MTTSALAQHPAVPDWLAGFNKCHQESYQPYRLPGVLADGQAHTDHDPATFAARLREVADLVEAHGDEIMVMADVYAFLREAAFCAPKVEGWCVMKHYHDHDPESGLWKPAVWIACTTQE